MNDRNRSSATCNVSPRTKSDPGSLGEPEEDE